MKKLIILNHSLTLNKIELYALEAGDGVLALACRVPSPMFSLRYHVP